MRNTLAFAVATALFVVPLTPSVAAEKPSRFDRVQKYAATFVVTVHETQRQLEEPFGNGRKVQEASIGGTATIRAILVDDGPGPDSRSFIGEAQIVSGNYHERSSIKLIGKDGTVTWSDEFSSSSFLQDAGARVAFNADRTQFTVDCPGVRFTGVRKRRGEIPNMVKEHEDAPYEAALATPGMKYVPTPATGMTLSGTFEGEGQHIPARVFVPLKPKLSCRYEIKPLEVEPEAPVTIDGLRCACDGKLRLQARTELKGGKFAAFEVKPAAGTPKEQKPAKATVNKDGVLELVAPPESAPGAEVTAVYVKGDKQYRSNPTKVMFCHVSKPIALAGTGEYGNGRNFVFSEDNPGKLEVKLRGKAFAGGRDVSEDLRWQLDPEDADFGPEFAKGKEQRYLAKALFSSNDQFGVRNIRTVYKAEGGCECQSEPTEIRLFFPLLARNNPDGDKPNWAYYWAQTSAGQGIDFKYVEKVPPSVPCVNGGSSAPTGSELANYDYCSDQIYLTPAVPLAGKCIGRQGSGIGVDTGIDCFGNTLRHEQHHRTELTGWWGELMLNYDGFNDVDVDMVPDDLEKTLKCSSVALSQASQRSCPGIPRHLQGKASDMEVNAYYVGWTWKVGSADHEDWAYPGKQWPDNPGQAAAGE